MGDRTDAEGSDDGADGGIRFTVAITVWKREQMLAHAFQSVLRQERPCSEILVLSDGHSRTVPEVVEPFRGDVSVRYLPLRRRRKTWGNHLRRRALEEATGSHLLILGHDCLLYPSCLAAHRRNLAADPERVSVVPIDYWRGTRFDGRMPRDDDVETVGEGEIDLLCLVLPRRRALAAGCFGEAMMRTRCADYLSFELLRRERPPVYAGGEPRAAHF
jgi:glycosyltransferase involved in cell wall biosynthesis